MIEYCCKKFENSKITDQSISGDKSFIWSTEDGFYFEELIDFCPFCGDKKYKQPLTN